MTSHQVGQLKEQHHGVCKFSRALLHMLTTAWGPPGSLTFKSRFVNRLFCQLMYFSCPVLIFIGERGL